MRIITAVLALALLGASPAALAQDPPDGNAPSAPAAGPAGDEGFALVARLRELQSQIQGIQQKALADPALAEQQQDLRDAIVAHVAEHEPAAIEAREELAALSARARAAQAAGEQEKIQAMAGRARELQAVVMQAQERAMTSEALQPKVLAFEEAVVAQMRVVDPKTDGYLAEAETIATRLRAMDGEGDAAANGAHGDATGG